ncbi:MAG: PaaI family thioesterase [Actinomycetota bacterium]|nr:DUF4442 domain-containing protein [Actinomycetota bacterium]
MNEFADILESIFRDVVPVLGHMGIRAVEAVPGRALLRLPYDEEISNHIGTVYAGVLFSFLETTGGAIILTSLDVNRWIPVIVQATIRYMRPVTGTIDAVAELSDEETASLVSLLEENPKSNWTITIRATDSLDNTVCEADLTYRFRSIG